VSFSDSFEDSGGLEDAAALEEALEADVASVVDAVSVIEAERDDYLDALRRLQADFENYRKRMAKQAADVGVGARRALVEKLLPVLDAADLAVAHGADEVAPIAGLLTDTLAKEGLEAVSPKPGEPFDPTVHEAVVHEPASSDGPPEVAEVLRAGYLWNGALLRPAMVKVRG
jgi:molecular chaperone GrpE